VKLVGNKYILHKANTFLVYCPLRVINKCGTMSWNGVRTRHGATSPHNIHRRNFTECL